MNSEHTQAYVWYPSAGGETLRQREERIAKDWLRENLTPNEQRVWLRSAPRTLSVQDVLNTICRYDSSELVDLLYPRAPAFFRKAQPYNLSALLLARLYNEGPFNELLLQQCIHARTAMLDAMCLFSLVGAVGCLERLLESGADPDGLETPDNWSYLLLSDGRILPVSPMDCAWLSDNEDCCLLLELYGGRMLHEHFPAEKGGA